RRAGASRHHAAEGGKGSGLPDFLRPRHEGGAVTLRDIRELKEDKEAYAAELERRWTGLLSYRYIGRRYGSMDLDADGDDFVRLRHDFRNSTGGLMVAPLAIASPEGGGRSDLEVVRNPVIHSAQ